MAISNSVAFYRNEIKQSTDDNLDISGSSQNGVVLQQTHRKRMF
jgi:hypothetical protein